MVSHASDARPGRRFPIDGNVDYASDAPSKRPGGPKPKPERSSSSDCHIPETANFAFTVRNRLDYEHEPLAFGAVIWKHMNENAPAFVLSTPRLQVMLMYDDGIRKMPLAVHSYERVNCVNE